MKILNIYERGLYSENTSQEEAENDIIHSGGYGWKYKYSLVQRGRNGAEFVEMNFSGNSLPKK